jgi:putative ABC transport system permease protein
MLTLLRTLSLGYFSQHRIRSVLVVLSIALGVATLVATQALSKGLGSGIQEGVNPLGGLADLTITNGEAGVPAGLARELRDAGIDGVEDVQPYVMALVGIVELGAAGKSAWLLGFDGARDPQTGRRPPLDDLIPGLAIRWTWKPSLPGGLLQMLPMLVDQPAMVSPNLAAALDAAGGARTFHLRSAGRTPGATRIGTVDFSKTSLPLKKSYVVVMDVRSASAICFPERPDHVQQLGVKLSKGTDRDAVQASLQEELKRRGITAEVRSLDASRQLVSDVTAGLEIGLAIGGAGALVVGLFLVYNALSVSVAERRHDIGILRSVGATRLQVARLFVTEATVMGVIGSLLGLPLGWLLAWLACKPMANVITDLLVPIDSAHVQLSWGLMALAVFSGTLVADLAALVPALQAAGEEPADAVRRVPQRHRWLLAVLQVASAIVLLLVGIFLADFRDRLPPRVGMFAGIVCLMVGGLALTPLLASLVGRLIQPLFRYFLGLGGRLAADNLVRSPGRTGLVIAALAATGGLLVQTAGFLKSSREAIRDWVDDKIAADLYVTSGSAITSNGSSVTMREEMGDKLKSIPGVEAVLPIRFFEVHYRSPRDGENRVVYLIGLDAKTIVRSQGDRPLARSLASYPQLEQLRQRGTVLVSENFAALYGIKVGDEIEFRGQAQRGRMVKARVAGLVTDYTWNRGTIVMGLDWFREEYDDRQVSIFHLFVEPGADPEQVRDRVMARFGQEEALFVLTRAEIHDDIRTTMQKVYGLAYAQQIVVGMVALLGVVSALFISVLQRRRELGLLRAVGATRQQILTSVLAEAVLMGAIGAVVGFAIGLLLEWYVLDVLILDESGFRFALRIPWLEAGVVTLASVLLATLAGLWPAYHATRLRIPEAIAYE